MNKWDINKVILMFYQLFSTHVFGACTEFSGVLFHSVVTFASIYSNRLKLLNGKPEQKNKFQLGDLQTLVGSVEVFIKPRSIKP